MFLLERSGPIHRSVPQGGFETPRLTDLLHQNLAIAPEFPVDVSNHAADNNWRVVRLSKENTILWVFGIVARGGHRMLWLKALRPYGTLKVRAEWGSHHERD